MAVRICQLINHFLRFIFGEYRAINGLLRICLKVALFYSFRQSILKTKLHSYEGYFLLISKQILLMWPSLSRLYDCLQHSRLDFPDIISKHVIPSANTSSPSVIFGLSLMYPQRIFSIWEGLIKLSSPSKIFSNAVMPLCKNWLSISMHFALEKHIRAGQISPCLIPYWSKQDTASVMEQMMDQTSPEGRGNVLRLSLRKHSNLEQRIVRICIYSQEMNLFERLFMSYCTTLHRWGWLRRIRFFTISISICTSRSLNLKV